jgi:hypothetical protein
VTKPLKTLAIVPITVVAHLKLKESRGTIWHPNRLNNSDEAILAELAQYGVNSI